MLEIIAPSLLPACWQMLDGDVLVLYAVSEANARNGREPLGHVLIPA